MPNVWRQIQEIPESHPSQADTHWWKTLQVQGETRSGEFME